MEQQYLGVVEDPRSDEQKSFDYKHEEVAMAGVPPVWVDKVVFKSYHIKNQDGSLSCVAQATSKLLGVHEVLEGRDYMDLSPKFIYIRRANYPGGGMWFQNALHIACKEGACKESQMPSDFTGEAFMNDRGQETPDCAVTALEFKGKNYISLPINMETIADVLSQGLPVLLGFQFDYNEWTENPTVKTISGGAVRHGVVATDFGMLNGVKVISIDDSWGPQYGKGGQRFITEEFLKAKCFYAGYALSFVKEVVPEVAFKYHWKSYMAFNRKTNDTNDVIALQKALQILGLFPQNIAITGFYGPITRKAVHDFQVKYVGKNNKGVQAGPLTLAVLNKKFQ